MSRPKQDLLCGICHDIFNDPVVLSCSHNICKSCLQSFWFGKDIKKCPVCKKTSASADPPRNAALRNVCENFMSVQAQKASADSEHLCAQHSEKLKLFCEDHLQPVCVICRDSKAHNNHKFRPIDEAAQDYRQELEGFLSLVREKLNFFEEMRENYDQTAKHIQVQSHNTEKQIREKFKKLQQFLQKEEEARIAALKKEVIEKAEMMKEKITSLDTEIASLSEIIQAIAKDLKAADVPFLQTYETAVDTINISLQQVDDPKRIQGALVDEATHLGNLSYNIWSKMKEKVSYSPVILDPNTAHNELLLSDDLTSVRREKKLKLPENPERIVSYMSVLGSEGFDSQTHSWEVEVGNSPVWGVGVSAESDLMKTDNPSKFLKISLCDGQYKAESSLKGPCTLQIKTKIKKIKVHLDCVKKQLSFSDPETNTNIHTFTYTFTEKLYPYFNVVNAQPLKIIPVTMSVELGLDRR